MNVPCAKMLAAAGFVAAVLAAATAVTAAADKEGDTRDEIINRMAKRLPKLRHYKDAGKIGETYNGLVEAVKEKDAQEDKALRQLATAENADRKAFYALTAKKFETTPEIVARSAGIRNFKAARPEHWLKLKSGKWVQKKNVKLPDDDDQDKGQKDEAR
jgi:uncharacterized protein YdbL (DUF1318 family)